MMYLLFGGEDYYPEGGYRDHIACYQSSSERCARAWAVGQLAEVSDNEWADLVVFDAVCDEMTPVVNYRREVRWERKPHPHRVCEPWVERQPYDYE